MTVHSHAHTMGAMSTHGSLGSSQAINWLLFLPSQYQMFALKKHVLKTTRFESFEDIVEAFGTDYSTIIDSIVFRKALVNNKIFLWDCSDEFCEVLFKKPPEIVEKMLQCITFEDDCPLFFKDELERFCDYDFRTELFEPPREPINMDDDVWDGVTIQGPHSQRLLQLLKLERNVCLHMESFYFDILAWYIRRKCRKLYPEFKAIHSFTYVSPTAYEYLKHRFPDDPLEDAKVQGAEETTPENFARKCAESNGSCIRFVKEAVEHIYLRCLLDGVDPDVPLARFFEENRAILYAGSNTKIFFSILPDEVFDGPEMKKLSRLICRITFSF